MALTRDGRRDIWVKRLPGGAVLPDHLQRHLERAARLVGRRRATCYYIADRSGSGGGPGLRPPGRRDRRPAVAGLARMSDIGQVIGRARRALADPPDRAAPHRQRPTSSGSRLGDTTLVPLVAAPPSELFPALSPDGRWLAYASNESGTLGGLRPPVSGDRVGQVAGLHRGRHRAGLVEHRARAVLHQRPRTTWSRRRSQRVATFSVGRQRMLFSTAQFAGGGPVPSYSLSPDNKRFLMLREGEAGQPGELVVAENWLQQLKAQAGR